jgi:hypothetical protein
VGVLKKHKAKAPAPTSEPHLIREGSYHRCSVCGYPFSADVYPTLNDAFAEHLVNSHHSGQTTEGDVNQAAARIVKEPTDS